MSRKKVERSLADLGGPLIFTKEDVMKVTGLGDGKVQGAINSRELKSFKYGGSRLIHSKDLYQWTLDLRNKGLDKQDRNWEV